MNKKTKKWLLVIGWMILIFCFSNQPGNESNKNNEFVVNIFNLLGINLNSVLGELTNFIIRKAAHFTEYFILAWLVFNAVKDDLSSNKDIIISVLVVFLYACTDEFHQSFVPGRACMFRDVMIDTSGGAFAMIIAYLISWKKSRSINKKVNK